MIKVSIVVPVYNVEKYINRCVNSLVNQTIQDIEIILVDDGSPDNCPSICDSWAKEYSHIKVVHKKNGGLSSARNAGLKIASGKYVGFVDSDDDVEIDMFKKMYITAEENHVDFVMCDYMRILNDKKYIKSLNIDTGVYDKNKIIKDIYPQLIMRNDVDYGPLLSVWHCLYSREFLLRNNLVFDEDVRWSEDNIFSSIVGFNANKFYYMKNEALYHYYLNPGTITTGYRKGAWGVYKTMNNHLHDFFDTIKEYDFSNQMNIHLIYYACNVIGMIASNNNFNIARQQIKEILNDADLIYALKKVKDLNINIKLKIQLVLMKTKNATLLTYLLQRR